MNRVILIGRLTADPKLNADVSVAHFSLAVDRKVKKEGGQTADFPNCVAFGKVAEGITKFFHKGMKIALEGRIQTGSYKNKNGETVYTTEVVVDQWEFCESKKAEEPQQENDWVEVPDTVEGLPFV